MTRLLLGFLTILTLPATIALADEPERTVTDCERGLIYGGPWQWVYTGIGAGVNVWSSGSFPRMAPESLKISQGRFYCFNAEDEKTWCYFPGSRLFPRLLRPEER
jgi:hypothetical protein